MKITVKQLCFSALFLALALVLPFLTGQIPTIGSMLLPMHIPVLLCGFLCGPVCGAMVGAIAPLLRSLIFGMPYLYPTAVAMAFELCAYGLFAGLLLRAFGKKPVGLYASLIGAMVLGRLVWGAVMFCITTASGSTYLFSAFWAGAVGNAIPGIVLQLVLIPPVVYALLRTRLVQPKR